MKNQLRELEKCRSGHDHIRWAETNGFAVSNGKGSHRKLYKNGGMVVCPDHDDDLGKGIMCKIRKALIALMTLGGLYILYFSWMVTNG